MRAPTVIDLRRRPVADHRLQARYRRLVCRVVGHDPWALARPFADVVAVCGRCGKFARRPVAPHPAPGRRRRAARGIPVDLALYRGPDDAGGVLGVLVTLLALYGMAFGLVLWLGGLWGVVACLAVCATGGGFLGYLATRAGTPDEPETTPSSR